MIAYVVIDSASGTVVRCGRGATLEDIARVRLKPGEAIAGTSPEDHVRVWNEPCHHYVHRGGALRKKTLLDLRASSHTLPADGRSAVTIVADRAAAFVAWVNGRRVKVPAGAFRLSHPTPADIRIEVDPLDPNFYTDRRLRPWSARGPGKPGAAIIVNAEEPRDE